MENETEISGFQPYTRVSLNRGAKGAMGWGILVAHKDSDKALQEALRLNAELELCFPVREKGRRA